MRLQAVSCFSVTEVRRISSLILTFPEKFKHDWGKVPVRTEQTSATFVASFCPRDKKRCKTRPWNEWTRRWGRCFYCLPRRKEWRWEWRGSSTPSAPGCTWTTGESSATSSCRRCKGSRSQYARQAFSSSARAAFTSWLENRLGLCIYRRASYLCIDLNATRRRNVTCLILTPLKGLQPDAGLFYIRRS